MNKRRVVITGMGIVSPVGLTLQENWQNITNGVSGISKIDHFDPQGFPCQIAGQVDGFDAANYMPAKEARKMDRFIQFGLAAGLDAFKDSGLEVTEQNAERIGAYIGSGIGGVQTKPLKMRLILLMIADLVAFHHFLCQAQLSI